MTSLPLLTVAQTIIISIIGAFLNLWVDQAHPENFNQKWNDSNLKVSSLFNDHMVLQQKDTIAIWGWAKSGEKVKVKTSWGASEKVIAEANGQWKTSLTTPVASFDQQWIKVSTKKQQIQLTDVLIGEVWLLSGQSNMGFRLKKEEHAAREIGQAHTVPIRLFNIQYDASDTLLQDFAKEVKWEVCDSISVREFSAVGYYFGKMLSREMPNIPVGLINASYGGATAEAFMSKETLMSRPVLSNHLRTYSNDEKPSKNPTYCYNAMIHPLIDYKIKGIAWYQGESNCVRASQYEETLTSLITSWRSGFNDDQLPFLVIQLPAYEYKTFQQEPGNPYSAATLRNTQLKVSQTLDNVGLVVTMDLGDVDDIHPKNKKPVGERLATQVLSRNYGFSNLPSASPTYKSYRFEGNSIYLTFNNIGKGLNDPYEALNWFTIAGKDRKFYQGNAFIVGEEIMVSSPFVKEPIAARYAWHNAALPNLYSKAGLLVSPFRTDNWKDFTYVEGITTWSSLPDIKSVPFDLSVSELQIGTPTAGARVKQQLTEYKATSVYHTVYLPTNWEEGKKYPVIVEYPGNGPYLNKYGDTCSGKPEDTYLGYGISGGKDFIWIGMPFISKDGSQNQLKWWGDVQASIDYTIDVVEYICANFGGNKSQVFVSGFSRGAIACNYIGMQNNEIADLWRGSIACSHYDGVRNWPYQNSDQTSAISRLRRFEGKPQLIIQENVGPQSAKAFIEASGVDGDYTYLTIPYRNHDSRWVLQDLPQREKVREWLKELINVK